METYKSKLRGKEREMRQKIWKHGQSVEREEKLCKRVLASCCHQTPIGYIYTNISNTHEYRHKYNYKKIQLQKKQVPIQIQIEKNIYK